MPNLDADRPGDRAQSHPGAGGKGLQQQIARAGRQAAAAPRRAASGRQAFSKRWYLTCTRPLG